jgi:hypothetical protein
MRRKLTRSNNDLGNAVIVKEEYAFRRAQLITSPFNRQPGLQTKQVWASIAEIAAGPM